MSVKFRFRHAAPAIAFLLFFSCQEKKTGDDCPAMPEEEKPVCIQEEWYCFNGKKIVRTDKGYGLTDTLGHEIIPAVYGEVVFLNDDIVLLQRLGTWLLSDGNGYIFAESQDREQLVRDSETAYESLLAARRDGWNRIIACYDSLSRSCLEVRSRSVSGTDMLRLESMQQDLTELLGRIHGSPSDDQAETLRRISSRYHTLAR